MAELFGLSLAGHLDNILQEVSRHGSIYGYPLKKMFKPRAELDLSVSFHGKTAATPLGPASGPHTQMAQNILLAFLGGSRIMELKTVQVMDELEIPRPCIDARNLGFNVEWSQELTLEASYHEYVTAWMLLKIIERMELLQVPAGDPFYHVIFDLSVGYDLEGISSPRVTRWIRDMMNAERAIAERLADLPDRYADYRSMQIDPKIATTLTLSTFHGCPRHEIQRIVEYLIGELVLDVMVKMNPTQLGFDHVAELLLDTMGYAHLQLEPQAFEEDLQFDEAVAMMERLALFAAERGRGVGAKFTNTLVVKNHDTFFKDEVMYLSGRPLHVISMNAMLRFRRAVGGHLPVSFSAGIDHENFVDSIACGMLPITVCTDLLGKGGYTRQVNYLRKLEKAFTARGVTRLDDFIRAVAGGSETVHEAGLINAGRMVPLLAQNPRYHHLKNRATPKKIGSKLELFDCLTCNICLPVCPNAANFSLPVGAVAERVTHYRWDGKVFQVSHQNDFELGKPAQIANLADFCNECGNCDVFCPEDGGPFIEKPRFFSSAATYQSFADYDGFYFENAFEMVGRIERREYRLRLDPDSGGMTFFHQGVEMVLTAEGHLVSAQPGPALKLGTQIDMTPFHIMKNLLQAVLKSNDYAATLLRGFAHGTV